MRKTNSKKSPESNARTYLEHLSGMAALVEWLAEGKRAGIDFDVTPTAVSIPNRASNRFCLGVPRSRRWGRHPFIAVQRREALFFKLLKIARAVIVRGDNKIHFITKAVRGDQENYPDIPPFVISVSMDSHDKTAMLSSAKSIQCRGFWFNDMGEIEISIKAVFWSVPISVVEKGAPLLTAADMSEGPSLSELVRMKIESTNVGSNPGYRG